MDFLTLLKNYKTEGKISAEVYASFYELYRSYLEATVDYDSNKIAAVFTTYLNEVVLQLKDPYMFQDYHEHILEPFDYYDFGLDFIRPVTLLDESKIVNKEIVDKISQQLQKGENAILLANHQIEADPQAISLLLEDTHPQLAKSMIFIAGHRVTTDPLAVPFSKGRNLLCIYSKRYIEDVPELKEERLQHNSRTMKKMANLLSEGGKCIYVAPSGGRDRKNKEGKVEVAPFDPQSVEMLYLMAQYSQKPTHFYPLALATYDLLPPPEKVKKKLGEKRIMKTTPIHMAFGKEVDMENFSLNAMLDKKQKKKLRTQYILDRVKELYEQIRL